MGALATNSYSHDLIVFIAIDLWDLYTTWLLDGKSVLKASTAIYFLLHSRNILTTSLHCLSKRVVMAESLFYNIESANIRPVFPGPVIF